MDKKGGTTAGCDAYLHFVGCVVNPLCHNARWVVLLVPLSAISREKRKSKNFFYGWHAKRACVHAPLTFRCLSSVILSLNLRLLILLLVPRVEVKGCWPPPPPPFLLYLLLLLLPSSSSLHLILSSASPPPQLQPFSLKFKIKGI